MKTVFFERPLLNVTQNTAVPLQVQAAEKPNTPAVLSPEGTTAELDIRLQADPDPSGSFQWQDFFKMLFTPSIAADGKPSLDIQLTSVLGNGTDGALQEDTFEHSQTMDNFLSQAGVGRSDAGGTMTTIVLIADTVITQGNRTYTNEGAIGDIVCTLPAATKDLAMSFVVKAAHYLKVQASGTDTIAYGPAATSAAGGYIRSNELQDTLVLQCFKTGEWNVLGQPLGSWPIDM